VFSVINMGKLCREENPLLGMGKYHAGDFPLDFARKGGGVIHMQWVCFSLVFGEYNCFSSVCRVPIYSS
jgi:hypothetical protein